MTQKISRTILTHIQSIRLGPKMQFGKTRQLLIVFVLEVASVQHKHLIVFVLEVFNTNSEKPRRGLGVTAEKIRWR